MIKRIEICVFFILIILAMAYPVVAKQPVAAPVEAVTPVDEARRRGPHGEIYRPPPDPDWIQFRKSGIMRSYPEIPPKTPLVDSWTGKGTA